MSTVLNTVELLEANIKNGMADIENLKWLKQNLNAALADRQLIVQISMAHRMNPDMPKRNWDVTVAALNAALDATTTELNERIKLVDKASKFFKKNKNNPEKMSGFGEYFKLVVELERNYSMLDCVNAQEEKAA